MENRNIDFVRCDTTEEMDIALKTDERLKVLYGYLDELYSMSMPIIVKVSPTEILASYSKEAQKQIDEINSQIRNRRNQIISDYKIQSRILR